MKGCAGPLHMRKVKKTRSQPSEQSRAAAPTCAGALLPRGERGEGVVNKLGGTGWLGGTCGHTLGASVWETHGQGRNCHIYDVDREPFSQGGLILLWRDFFVDC